MKLKRACAYYDVHYPKHNKPTLECLLDYVKQNPPDVFIFGGDQLDFASISHHNYDKPLYRTRKSYLDDIRGFDRDILTPLEALLPKGCEKVWIIGNHERWEYDFIEKHPELEELMDHTRILDLVARGWRIIPLGHCYRLGKLRVVHGEVLTGIGNQAGMYPSRKAVELYAASVLAGHTHAPQSFTKISPVEQTNKWMGWIAPCGGDVNPTYLSNRPTAWLNGFVLIDSLSDGQFNVYPIIISKGRFAYGGKIYGRKDV